MQRLLTGNAVTSNRRHRRYGRLFQNRYKSILCLKGDERIQGDGDFVEEVLDQVSEQMDR
ncbi:MAG: hypothetical protein HY788_04715 [Deltaproteobacteria bacterium]|nr:hypothetical protein [Deltaproteobacteria bacterium]